MSNERGRAWVEVDLGAVVSNARKILARTGNVPLIPMVKADAYGVGLGPVVGALRDGLPSTVLHAFGVATVQEGERLRTLGWDGRVIVFSPIPPNELGRATAASLEIAVSSLDQLEQCAAAAGPERPIPVHTEIDTGMGRAGFPVPGDAEAWVREIRGRMEGRVEWSGCFTHFHSADARSLASSDSQWARFEPVRRRLSGEDGIILHACNSAAALRRPQYALDAVRPGIFLYGGDVSAEEQPDPVVCVRARVGLVADAPAGRTVGYGAEHAAARAERWATILIGYGDGIPRSLWAGRGRFLLHGRTVPIVGRISMDVVVVDISGLDDVAEGDVVTVIGRDGEDMITIDEIAARCGTISYEILTGLTARLPRIYQP